MDLNFPSFKSKLVFLTNLFDQSKGTSPLPGLVGLLGLDDKKLCDCLLSLFECLFCGNPTTVWYVQLPWDHQAVWKLNLATWRGHTESNASCSLSVLLIPVLAPDMWVKKPYWTFQFNSASCKKTKSQDVWSNWAGPDIFSHPSHLSWASKMHGAEMGHPFLF